VKRIAKSIIDKMNIWLLLRNEMESEPLRALFKNKYDVDVGLYSYGCFDQWRIPRGTSIGRYCSFAKTVRILDANHPIEALSTHPYLYEAALGVTDANVLRYSHCSVGDDVWISHNVTVTPGCVSIGRGAIIGAGAVVTKNVEPYSIVTGAPARVLRMRFNPAVIEALEQSRWWEMDKSALTKLLRDNPVAAYDVAASTPAAIAAMLAVRA
jgi:acetyltransferase-like isoleucine patch superfamily enzyme